VTSTSDTSLPQRASWTSRRFWFYGTPTRTTASNPVNSRSRRCSRTPAYRPSGSQPPSGRIGCPFPGYDRVLIRRAEFQAVIDDSRFAAWRTALGSVQGIYLITDKITGKHYVGKADGGERILGRWMTYARDGHGGNVALRASANR
jgi:hypothetical protein